MEEKYPFIAIRMMPGVVSRSQIIFKDKAGKKEMSNEIPNPDNSFIIINSHPYDQDGNLTKEAKDEVIRVILEKIKNTGHRMCVVFGKDESVFCESDGSTKAAGNDYSYF
ncbi:MAG: hypothetical protein WCK90_04955 [archaeon]